MLIYILTRSGIAWGEFKAYRLIQFHSYITNHTQFGSTYVSINHKIADINSIPSSNQVILTPIENVSISKISPHILASSPIVFFLPLKPIDTNLIEYYLINSAHKASIYFSTEIQKIPKNYTFLKASHMQTNSIKQNTILSNIISTINLSENLNQCVILITTSYDTFSAAPTLHVGANNGIVISSFLEIIHILSKYYLPQNYAFIFAMTNGRFCGNEGIQHFLDNNQFKIDFAVSIESIFTQILHGHLGIEIEKQNFEKKDDQNQLPKFEKFLINLKNTLNQVQIPFEIKLSDALFSQTIFNQYKIPSISISGGPLYSSLTDTFLNVSRSDDFTWAFSEAIFRTIYNSPPMYEIVDKKFVNTSFWAKSIGNIPRLAPFMDQTLPNIFNSWMNAFTDQVFVEEWESSNCFIPYSSTECLLNFYNPIPTKTQILLIVLSLIYALCIYILIAGCNSIHLLCRNLFSHLYRCFCFLIKKRK